MLIYIRVDSSIQLGSGHVMRCLTLAHELQENGGEIVFLCRNLVGNLSSLVEQNGFTVYLLPEVNSKMGVDNPELLYSQWQEDFMVTSKAIRERAIVPDLLVVDHYALDERWENAIKAYVRRVMVIDDLANRRHYCDILLDNNYYANMKDRYHGLVPQHCKMLLGPSYALLRHEFIQARCKVRVRNGLVKRMLVFISGSDPTNETAKVLLALKMMNLNGIITDVIVGNSNPNREIVRQLCLDIPSTYFHCQVDNMADYMANADLAIGAGGTATWERCYLGLPTIAIIVADNQELVVKDVAKYGALVNAGRSSNITSVSFADTLQSLISNHNFLLKLSKKSLNLMSGYSKNAISGAIYMGES